MNKHNVEHYIDGVHIKPLTIADNNIRDGSCVIYNPTKTRKNMEKVVILRANSAEIRMKIRAAGIKVCSCATLKDADWLDYHSMVGLLCVHGNGYALDGMTKAQTRKTFLENTKNPIWCDNVDDFIAEIKKTTTK